MNARRWIVAIAVVVAASCAATAQDAPRILTTRPDAVAWRTPPGAADGRERAVIHGDPDAGAGFWTYRIRTTAPIRVEAHTHPVDEYITVLEGDWSLGEGARFDESRLKTYPAGSFVHIPAGAPHFVATGAGVTVIQSSGAGPFRTEFIPPR
ncbi:MAG: cupin domain-containing protein [Hyphomonadaceae bacterium]|nr:cupin domain-containing protein [Hyphomonadaceae bacterium]